MVDHNSLCNKILSKVHDDSTRTKSTSTTKSQALWNTCNEAVTFLLLQAYSKLQLIRLRYLLTWLDLHRVDPHHMRLIPVRKWSHEPSSFSSWFFRGSWQLNSICKSIQTRWQQENDHILITLLQTQHMALCLLAVNSFSQLALHHLQLNTYLPIVHLNCKQREKKTSKPLWIYYIWSHYWSHSPGNTCMW